MNTCLKSLTQEQLADVLDISVYTIRKLVDERELPYVYEDRKLSFDMKDLLSWFSGKEKESSCVEL
jgi:excisionase family DNA binding protein